MKSKSMKGGRCPNCNCGKRGGAYGKGMHSKLVGAPLSGGYKKKSLRKSKSKRVGSKKSRKMRVKSGGSIKCPGFKLNLEKKFGGLSAVDRYETCETTN